MKKIAAIFAGGVGQRMGSDIPKQFLNVYGKPIIIHTLEKFQYNDQIDSIYVGCKEEYIPYLIELVKKFNITKIDSNCILSGGASGQETIYKILKRISEDNPTNSIVLIHDGVRPLIDDDLINRVIECTIKNDTAITCAPCYETPIVSADGKMIDNVLQRNTIFMAKAPQCFILKNILDAHEKYRNIDPNYENKKIVDSCSLYMSIGNKVKLVEGNRENIKVTTPEDYINLLAMLAIEDQKQIFMLNKKD